MNKLKYLSPLALSVAILALTGCSDKKDSFSGAPAKISVAYPEVDSIVLHKEYPGYLTSANTVTVVARVSGTLERKFYEDGAIVKAGQPLFAIESTVYRQKVAAAKAHLETAKAQNDYASKNYEAMKKALESDAVSKMDVIQAESSLRESEAAIYTAQAALTTAELMLNYCIVKAPITGQVQAAVPNVGDYIAGEDSPVTLTTIYDNSRVSVNFGVEDSGYIAYLRSENKGKLNFDSIPVEFPGMVVGHYIGNLSYSAPAVNRSTGTVAVRLDIDNPKGELRSGMYTKIKMPVAIDPKAILVKDASIGTDQLGKYVYIVNDSNRVVYTPVKIGELYNDSLRVITSGLKANDRYVTKALMKVRDGQKVEPELN